MDSFACGGKPDDALLGAESRFCESGGTVQSEVPKAVRTTVQVCFHSRQRVLAFPERNCSNGVSIDMYALLICDGAHSSMKMKHEDERIQSSQNIHLHRNSQWVAVTLSGTALYLQPRLPARIPPRTGPSLKSKANSTAAPSLHTDTRSNLCQHTSETILSGEQQPRTKGPSCDNPRKPPLSAGTARSATTPDPTATVLADPDACKHRNTKRRYHRSVGTRARATQVIASNPRHPERGDS